MSRFEQSTAHVGPRPLTRRARGTLSSAPSMPRPDLLLIGAQKAGTTSLYRYLGQHPRVLMSRVKEPGFLSWLDEKSSVGPAGEPVVAQTLARWEELFEGCEEMRADGEPCAVGEATTAYLYAPGAPARAVKYVPDARVVALLRQPAERAFSNWLHARREGREPISDFVSALGAEDGRVASNWGPMWHYTRKSRYAPQLQRWRRYFGDRMLVLTTDELDADGVGTCQRIFRFLGLDDAFVPDVERRWNAGGAPRGLKVEGRLHRALIAFGARVPPAYRRQVRDALFPRVELDEALRREVTERFFGPDIAHTEALLDRDLGAWRR